jgi:phosphate transport system substrate-binding protein
VVSLKNSILLFVIIFISFFPFRGVAENRYSLVIPGTGDSQQLFRQLALLFEQDNPDMRVTFPDSTGSGGGIQAVAKGKAVLGRTARLLKENEVALGLKEYPFARVPIVFAVHPSVTNLTDLTTEQILGIFSGEIANWRVVGGPDHKIYVVNREHGDTNYDVLATKMPGFSAMTPVGVVKYSQPAATQAIAKHEYTIGYLSLASALGRNLVPLAIDGIDPCRSNYVFVTSLHIISKGKVGPFEKRFIDFLFTDPARQLMRKSGVLPLD